ncbi:MAG: hypothetical protein IPK82_40575 [Polyangiaceae bacterium]|nr:hypothetical protein [Polyangiaceae bacterium]
MARWLWLSFPAAIALFVAGCGGDASEDAPALATASPIAKAPPNAIGADIPRPPLSRPQNEVEPEPILKGPKGGATPTPPAPGTDPSPPTGTNL